MYSDKKVEDGKLRFVLFDRIGNATFPHHITEEEVRQTLV
jgi:3-dehydroquinate synthetase